MGAKIPQLERFCCFDVSRGTKQVKLFFRSFRRTFITYYANKVYCSFWDECKQTRCVLGRALFIFKQ